ncbi:MAG: ABC transporter permease [Pseudoclavibacter sp.]|jgi:teichoic acid transport system permease protein
MATADDAEALAARYGLRRVGTRPALGPYLRSVWGVRDFILTLARYRVRAQDERFRLGMLWIVLKPVFDAAVYGAVFGLVLGSHRPPNYVPFLVTGVFTFSLFRGCIERGTRSLTGNAALIHSIRFPRMAMPLSEVVRELINFLPVLAILLIVVLAFGTPPSWQWLLLVPVLAIYVVFCAGLALIFARLNAVSRDVQNVVPLIIRLLLWGSGVFFDVHRTFAHNAMVLHVFEWTPLAPFLGLMRGLLLPGYLVTGQQWIAALVWALALALFGVVFFWQAEERYGQYV